MPRAALLRAQTLTLLGGLCLSASLACQSPALVRTARTLPEGSSDLSFSLNLTRVELGRVDVEGVGVPVQDFNLPNPIPDVLYDHGLTDDVELGGRVSLGSGLFEVHTTWRFLQAASGTLHMAAAPALGYRVLGLVNGPVATLPLIVTYDLSPGMSLSGGPVVSFASYSVPGSFDFGDLDLSGDTLYAGGGLGIELRPTAGIHLMPAIEVQRSVLRRGGAADLPVIDMLFFGVTLGWGGRGRPAREAPPLPPAPPPAPEGAPPDWI